MWNTVLLTWQETSSHVTRSSETLKTLERNRLQHAMQMMPDHLSYNNIFLNFLFPFPIVVEL